MTRIVEAELRKCEIPLASSYTLSEALGTLEATTPIYLRLRTESGETGVGESVAMIPFTEKSPDAVMALLAEYVPTILSGVDPTNPNALQRRMAAVLGEDNLLAKAAIDMACYDLYGKLVDRPVYELLGGRLRSSIPILKPLGNDSPEANARKAQRELDDGFGSFMLKTGQYSIETDLERLSTLRAQVGEDVPLVVDANQGWDSRTAIEFASRAHPSSVRFLEQPVPSHDVDGLRRIRQHSQLPVSCDESLFSVRDARRLLTENAVDVFSLKVIKHGGITPTRELMVLADSFGKQCFMNSMIETGVAQAASLHVGVTCPSLVEMGHAYMSPLRLGSSVTNYEDRFVSGSQAVVPEAPGLGVELDEGMLDEHTVETVSVQL